MNLAGFQKLWGKLSKRRVINTEKMPAEILHCLNCGSEQFYEGPSGGLAVNVKCANPKCGLWYNNTPFGLDYIGIKHNVGEEKEIVWYCPNCKITHNQRDFETEEYLGKYPHCPKCKTPLKVCWSYDDFPIAFCNNYIQLKMFAL